MKRFMLPTSAAIALMAPGAAAAKPPTAAHAHAYERAYAAVAHALGQRAPGRNIVKDGMAPNRPATDADVQSSLVVLERMLAPPQASAAPPTTTSTQSAAPAQAVSAPATSSAGAGGVPACASESGTNYSTGSGNTNGSTGATGRYQITPATAANYGCSLATAGGQDACAQTIYEHQGASAWVGCGG